MIFARERYLPDIVARIAEEMHGVVLQAMPLDANVRPPPLGACTGTRARAKVPARTVGDAHFGGGRAVVESGRGRPCFFPCVCSAPPSPFPSDRARRVRHTPKQKYIWVVEIQRVFEESICFKLQLGGLSTFFPPRFSSRNVMV